MAFVPTRFRPQSPAATLFPTFDRLFGSDPEASTVPGQGSPFARGGAHYVAYCLPWAPPFEDEVDDLG